MLQPHSRSPLLQLGQGHIHSDEKNLTCTTVPENCKVDPIVVFPNSGDTETELCRPILFTIGILLLMVLFYF